MLHIIWSIIIGFIVGLCARAIMPGVQHLGFIMTTLLGIGGSIIGGLIGRLFSRPTPGSAFHTAGFIVSAFENATIPASEFTHAAHIAVALSYLDSFPPEQALELMREKIRAFAAHHGVGNLYHETLTTFWMRLLEHVANTSEVDLPLWRRINLIVEDWTKRRPVEAHYSRELIRSQAARDKWVPPDRLPIPF